jgi:hypothetical protein
MKYWHQTLNLILVLLLISGARFTYLDDKKNDFTIQLIPIAERNDKGRFSALTIRDGNVFIDGKQIKNMTFFDVRFYAADFVEQGEIK